jgi:hypothetical protein
VSGAGGGDPVDRALYRLAVLAPDQDRVAAVRERCRRRMRRSSPARLVVPALCTGLCLLYLTALVYNALALLR